MYNLLCHDLYLLTRGEVAQFNCFFFYVVIIYTLDNAQFLYFLCYVSLRFLWFWSWFVIFLYNFILFKYIMHAFCMFLNTFAYIISNLRDSRITQKILMDWKEAKRKRGKILKWFGWVEKETQNDETAKFMPKTKGAWTRVGQKCSYLNGFLGFEALMLMRRKLVESVSECNWRFTKRSCVDKVMIRWMWSK